MSCKFCKGALDPVEDRGSDTCGACWYGMRLEPDQFEKDMAERGVEIAEGGHGFAQIDDGSIVHFNRAPYRLASEPAPVNPTRAQLDEWTRTGKRRLQP